MQQDKKKLVEFIRANIKDKLGNLIFRELTFEIKEGQSIFILGHDDKERTLILYTILGLLKPSMGLVKVFGNNIKSLNEIKLLSLRSRIGYVHPQRGLIDNISLRENIILPLRYNSNLSDEEIDERLNTISEAFKLNEIIEMNGWELDNVSEKKILFARSIIHRPEILLIDEPTTYIEQKDVEEILELIKIVFKRHFLPITTSIVITTENEDFALKMADKILCLEDGRLKYFRRPKKG